MARGRSGDITTHYQTLFQAGAVGTLSDGRLLEQFVNHRDGAREAAFRALVERHGPMVLRVCRSVLGDTHDAEDALQATFLVLARRADSIRKRESIGSWLHGVAQRVAQKTKTAAARRRVHEARSAEQVEETPHHLNDLGDLTPVLHQEIDRLPAKYRAPIVLCYLEGMTHELAASNLGWPIGTVRGRLSRARDLLRSRLIRRGLALSSGAVASGWLPETASAALPAALTETTVQGAMYLSAAQGSARFAVVLVAEAVLRDMAIGRVMTTAAVLVAIGVAGTSTVLLPRLGRAKPAGNPVASSRLKSTPQPAATDIGGDALPPGAVARLGAIRFQHGDVVHQVAYAPDGTSLVSVGADGVARVWDTTTGRERALLSARGERVRSLMFAPQGQVFAVAEENGKIRIHDGATWQELRRIETQDWGTSVALSSNGKVLAAGGRPGRPITLWDVDTGRALRQLEGHRRGTRSLALAPNGQFLVTTGIDAPVSNPSERSSQESEARSLRVWDATTGKEIWNTRLGSVTVEQIAFSPGGRAFAGGQSDKTIRLWDVATGQELRRFDTGSREFRGLAFTPDGKALAWGDVAAIGDLLTSHTEFGTIHLCDLGTGQELRQWEANAGGTSSLAFAPDGSTLATSGTETVVRLWDVASGRELLPNAGHLSRIGGLAFTPDGKAVITGGQDGTIRFWDPLRGTELRRFERREEPMNFLSLSCDGQILATGGLFSTPRLWDVSTGRELRGLPIAPGPVFSVSLSCDGKTLALAREGIHLWDLATGRERVDIHFPSRGPRLKDIHFTSDGNRLGGTDGAFIYVWDLASGQELHRLRLTADEVTANRPPFDMVADARFVFSPDGKTVAAAGHLEDTVALLDLRSGRVLARIPGDGARYKSLAFSPDGRLLASGHSSNAGRPGLWGSIRLWDVSKGHEIGRLEAHRNLISALAFSPDGTRLASAGEDAVALIWNISAFVSQGRPRAVRTATKNPTEQDAVDDPSTIGF